MQKLSDSDAKPSKLRRIALWTGIPAPAVLIVFLVLRFSVNIPYADEWTIAPLYQKAFSQTLSWNDLFFQQNEHRFFFPRLFLVIFAVTSHGDTRMGMFFSILLCIGTATLTWRLLQRTDDMTATAKLGTFLLINMILFSPIQQENWLWNFQSAMFLVALLVVVGASVATSKLSLANKFWLCAVVAAVATYSFGNGILLWFLSFPLGLIAEKSNSVRIRWLAAWFTLFVGAIALYLVGYTRLPNHSLTVIDHQSFDYFLYLVTFLGGHFWRSTDQASVTIPAVFGCVLLILYSSLARIAWAKEEARSGLLPWLAIGLFAIASACMAAVTRVGFGVNQALDSRYTTFSLLLSVSILGGFAVSKSVFGTIWPRRNAAFSYRLEGALLAVFLLAWMNSTIWGIQAMSVSHRQRLWGKAALLFGNVIASGDAYGLYLGDKAANILPGARIENKLGLIRPPLFQSADIQKLPAREPASLIGNFDGLHSNAGLAEAYGWAALPGMNRAADAVVLTAQDADGSERVFALTDQIYNRPDVVKAFGRSNLSKSGWQIHFSSSLLIHEPESIKAWAVDAKRGILYKLGGAHQLP